MEINTKITTDTFIDVTLADFELYLREKGLITDEQKLYKIEKSGSKDEQLRFCFSDKENIESCKSFRHKSFDDINISNRLRNQLSFQDIWEINDITEDKVRDLALARNMGKGTFLELQVALLPYDISILQILERLKEKEVKSDIAYQLGLFIEHIKNS